MPVKHSRSTGATIPSSQPPKGKAAASPTDLEILPSGREYVQQLDNYICNVDTKKLEWLPMTETLSSFYIFTTTDSSSEVEKKELELWILRNIKQSNLGDHDLED